MSMDGIDRMGDDPFAGQRRAWAEQLEKAQERIAALTVQNGQLREQLARLGQSEPPHPDLMPGDMGESTLHPEK